jgi:hypothetical protein
MRYGYAVAKSFDLRLCCSLDHGLQGPDSFHAELACGWHGGDKGPLLDGGPPLDQAAGEAPVQQQDFFLPAVTRC